MQNRNLPDGVTDAMIDEHMTSNVIEISEDEITDEIIETLTNEQVKQVIDLYTEYVDETKDMTISEMKKFIYKDSDYLDDLLDEAFGDGYYDQIYDDVRGNYE